MLQSNGRGEQEQPLTAAPASVWPQLQIPEVKQHFVLCTAHGQGSSAQPLLLLAAPGAEVSPLT